MKDLLTIILFLIVIISYLYFLYAVIKYVIYNPLMYNYGKPKYRRNKDGYVEYYDYLHNHWWLLTEWDSNEINRVICISTHAGIPIKIPYKGPGRNKMYIECDMNQKGFRSQFKYKTTKEIYEEMTEQINNEDIITSKVLSDVVTYKLNNKNND